MSKVCSLNKTDRQSCGSSGRQPFIAASTGEAELLGYSEGHQEAESVGALLGELGMDVNYVIYGDCRAALSLASTEAPAPPGASTK